MLEAGNTRFLVAGAVYSPHGPRFLFIKRRGGETRLSASSKCAKIENFCVNASFYA